MKDGLNWLEMKTCFMCGNRFSVLYPQMWRYKRDRLWFCSWHCLYGYDQKGSENMREMVKLTEEQRNEALGRALNGENPLAYLKAVGVRNPSTSWQNIRKWAQKNWTEEQFALLPEHFREKKKPTVELVYDESIAEEYRREQAEKQAALEEKIRNLPPVKAAEPEPDPWDMFDVTAVRGKIGEFYYDRDHGTVDWRNDYGEEVSLPPEEWRRLADKIPLILRALKAE